MTDSTNISAEAAVDAASTDDLNSTADLAASESASGANPAERVQLAQAVVEVPMPNPGETVTIAVAPGQTLRLGFDYAAAGNGELQENGDLVLPVNGGQVIIVGFADAATFEPPVELTNNDGSVIELGDFLVAIDVPLDVLVETAAGTPGPVGPLPETVAPNQGAGFSPGPGPVILGALNPEGPVDPTALRYRVPEREPRLFDLEETDGPDAQDDGPGTNNEAVCVDEENLIDGGEGGYGYDFGGVIASEFQVGVAPTDGVNQFGLTASAAFNVSAIEAFFGLPANTLRDFQPGELTTDGGAMRTEVTVSAGDTLTFDFNFLDAESDGQTFYMDFAVVVIGDQVFELADVTDATSDGPTSPFISFNEQTGYLTFNYVFPAAGTFQIGFAVMNDQDTSVDPALLIDNVVITGAGGDVFVDSFEAGAGNWDVLGGIGSFSSTSVSDNVLDNDSFGPDGPGGIVGITYAGGDSADPLTVTDDGGSPLITFTANDGSNDIWTLQFNLDTGDYTFTLLSAYQHSGAGADEAHERFTYTIVDSNGDTDSATLSICIQDDVPTVFIGGEGSVTLDETDNDGDDGDVGGLLATQTFAVGSLFFINTDFGADGPGDVEFALVLSTPGADSGLVDTATGDPVLLTLESGDVVGRNGDGDEVFRVHLDTVTDQITVTQSRAVVHDDPTDPDESGSPETILGGLIGLQATIIDDDGDTDTDIAELGALIRFEDDGPTGEIVGGEGLLRLDESVGYDFADDNADDETLSADPNDIGFASVAVGEFFAAAVNFGSDGPGDTVFALSLSAEGADSGLVHTATGNSIFLFDNGGVIEGREGTDALDAATGTIVFTVQISGGNVEVHQYEAIEHNDFPSDHDENDDPESITGGVLSLSVTATDGDGDPIEGSIDLGSRLLFEDDGPTVGLSGAEGTAVLDESVGYDPADPNATDDENPDAAPGAIGFATLGSAAFFTVDAGSDGEDSRAYALTLSAEGADSGLDDTLSGNSVFLFLVGGQIVGKEGTDATDADDNGDTVFTIDIDGTTGLVSINQFRAIVHDDPTDPDESGPGEPESMLGGLVGVELTVTDGDGDTDSETVDLGPKILFEDDGPAGEIGGGEGLLRLDESVGYDFADGNANDEEASVDPNDIGFASTAAGAFFFGAVDFGSDGPGAAATFELLLSANGANSGLVHTASGHPIFLFDNGGVIEGREGTDALDAATGTIVFTVSIVGGNVEVHQYEAVVHDDAPTDHDENDDPESIGAEVLGLSVTATDGDGDPISAVVDLGPKILFEDDGPTASLAPKTQGVFLTLDESVGADALDPNADDETDPDAAPGAIGFSSAFVTDLFNETVDVGEDGPGSSVTGKTYELTLSAPGADSGMDDTETGANVLLFLEGGDIVGRAGGAGGEIVFTIEIDGATGEIEVNQFRAVEHDDVNDHDEGASPETIDAGLVGVQLTVTDGDGDEAASAIVELGQLIKFEDDGPKASIQGGEGEIRLDETDGDADDGAPGGLLANVTVLASALFTETVDAGEDGQASKVYGADLSAPNVDSGLDDTLTGQNVLLQQLDAQTIVGTIDGGATEVFRITVNAGTGDVTVTQSRAVEHGDPTDPDEADTPQSILAGLVDYTLTVTDGDGDTATDTLDLGQLIKFEDDGPTFDSEAADTSTVSESDPLPDVSTGSIGVDFGSDGPGDVSSITGPAGLFSDGDPITYVFNPGTNTLTGSAGGNTIFTVSIDTATGDYTFTLSGPIDHGALEDSKTLNFSFTATDGDNDPVNGSFAVNVIDDEPSASNDTADTTGSFDSINVVIVFDRSGSMDEDPNVEGFSTRLDLARAAIASLLAAYDSFADVNIKIVDFAGNANHSEWFTGPDALVEANAYLGSLSAEGETDYAAAIDETRNFYDTVGDPAPTADKSVVYFLSDGNPTEGGDGATHQLTPGQTGQWETFLANNDIETAFAVGIGSGVNADALDEIAFPNDNPDNPAVLDDESEIFDTLLLTVTGLASGNVLTDGTPDDFGADGQGTPVITSILIGADLYEYDGTNIEKNGVLFAAATALLVADPTALGGVLTFNFATGDYDYEAADGSGVENFTYTILDGDGDLDDATLTINVIGTDVLTPNLVHGGAGNDTLVGNVDPLAEIVSGDDGDDHMTANGSDDLLIGGAGSDAMFGGGGRDVLIGGTQGENINGSIRAADGADYLDGGDGADFMFGNEGNDIFIVGTGDVAVGAQGSDFFVLTDNVNFDSIDGTNPTSPGEFSIAGTQRGNILAFDGTLNLTALANNKIAGIETITMADAEGTTNHSVAGSIAHFANVGSDTLTLDASDVISMGAGVFNPDGSFDPDGGVNFGTLTEQDAIRVDGDAGDTLNLNGGGWFHVTSGQGNIPAGYELYAHDGGGSAEDAYVLVQTTITVTGAS